MKKLIIIAAFFGILLTSCRQEPTKKITREDLKANKGTSLNSGKDNPEDLSIRNMKEAYKGESSAHLKYAAYSKRAAEDGYQDIALLFKAASQTKLIQANNHKAVLERTGESVTDIKPDFSVKTTQENIEEARESQTAALNMQYLNFIENAAIADDYMAQISLVYAHKVAAIQHTFYKEALANLKTETNDGLTKVYYLCPTCGNTYANKAPSRCEISLTDSKLFTKLMSERDL